MPLEPRNGLMRLLETPWAWDSHGLLQDLGVLPAKSNRRCTSVNEGSPDRLLGCVHCVGAGVLAHSHGAGLGPKSAARLDLEWRYEPRHLIS